MPVVLTPEQVAAVLGVSRKRIANLCAEGTLHRDDAGQITAASVKAHISHREDDRTGYRTSRAAYMSEKARMAALQRQLTEKGLIPAEQIAPAWRAIVLLTRDRLRVVPAKLAQQIAVVTTPGEAQKMMLDAIDEALTEIANFDPITGRRRSNGHADTTGDGITELEELEDDAAAAVAD